MTVLSLATTATWHRNLVPQSRLSNGLLLHRGRHTKPDPRAIDKASVLFPKWALSLLGSRLTRAERRPR